MKKANYGYTKQLSLGFEDAIEKTKAELKVEGFGVLTEIDVKSTLESKLDVSLEKYIILGACNPKAAYEALQIETEIGLMLPCNFIVYQKDSKTFVSTIMPSVAMGMIDNSELSQAVVEIEKVLKKVIDSI